MSQNDKDSLLEKFLARALSEADKTAFEDLVRVDDTFAQEVALRLAEADAFHWAREAEKANIRRRWRQRRWLLWAARATFMLFFGFGVYWLFYAGSGNGNTGAGGQSGGVLQDTSKNFCIRDSLWLDSIPPKPVAGQISIRWEEPFAARKYQEALSAVNEYLSNIDTALANDPRACAVGGALNICLHNGDLNKAVKYLEIVKKNKRYWEQKEYKSIKILLMFAYICTGDCDKARSIKVEQSLPSHLRDWLETCAPKR